MMPLLQPPDTATTYWVKPVVQAVFGARDAVSSDPSLELAVAYIKKLQATGRVSQEVVDDTINLVEEVRATYPSLSLPTIAAVDGLVGLTWDITRHHVNIEILPDRSVEFFSKDFITGDVSTADASPGTTPNKLIEQLRLLF